MWGKGRKEERRGEERRGEVWRAGLSEGVSAPSPLLCSFLPSFLLLFLLLPSPSFRCRSLSLPLLAGREANKGVTGGLSGARTVAPAGGARRRRRRRRRRPRRRKRHLFQGCCPLSCVHGGESESCLLSALAAVGCQLIVWRKGSGLGVGVMWVVVLPDQQYLSIFREIEKKDQ